MIVMVVHHYDTHEAGRVVSQVRTGTLGSGGNEAIALLP
jgi:hypothetical protein